MPRSGPRPYECIRRAWHSDRHQPVRASLIREVFSVVNEIHSSATKKNKEWQEKIPIVVLKAEEIMYSKANSEAEYTDLKTLWDRANDAINTIIRQDDSAETGGVFLQPCIEAALILGCVARRASRSQRYSNPRCYLSPITSDVPSGSASIVEKANHKDLTSNSQYMPHCSKLVKPMSISSTLLGTEPSMKFTNASENVPPGYDQCSPRDNQATSAFSSYPLYHIKCPKFEKHDHGCSSLPKPVSNTLEPAKISVIPNLFSNGDKSINAQSAAMQFPDKSPAMIGCDLSLRLGSLSSRCPSSDNILSQETKDVGAYEGTMCSDRFPQLDKLPFFPKGNEHGPVDLYPSQWSFEGGFLNVQSTTRKRKADLNHPTEDTKFCRQPEVPFSLFNGSMKNGGL